MSRRPRTLNQRIYRKTLYKDDLAEIIEIFAEYGHYKIEAKGKTYSDADEFFAAIGKKPLYEMEIRTAKDYMQGAVSLEIRDQYYNLEARCRAIDDFDLFTDLNEHLFPKRLRRFFWFTLPELALLLLFGLPAGYFLNYNFSFPVKVIIGGAPITILILLYQFVNNLNKQYIYASRESPDDGFLSRNRDWIPISIATVVAATLSSLITLYSSHK